MTDTAGIVNFVYFNGKVEKINLGSFTSGHFFDFKDVDGDGHRDYIFLDKGYLKVIKHNKTKLFDYNFSEGIIHRPVYYHFSYSDRKLGIVSESKKLIYLINNDGSLYKGFPMLNKVLPLKGNPLNNDGSLYKGFPLRGSTLFSIGNFASTASQFNLIVGSNENFLLNYIVQ